MFVSIPKQGMEGDGGTIRSRTSRSRCVQNTTFGVVSLFLLLTCVVAIAWLVMKPQEPSIRVSSLSVSDFSVSDSQLRGTYDIVFNMSNPNKKIDMFLHEFSVSMSYDKVKLAWGTVQDQEAISLERTRMMNLRVHIVMKADSPKLRKNKLFAQVAEEWRRRRKVVVNFDVRMEVSVRFDAGNWPPTSKLLNLNCGDVAVVFSRDHKDAAGKLVGVGGKGDCHV